jgi:NADPH:quinone reductase
MTYSPITYMIFFRKHMGPIKEYSMKAIQIRQTGGPEVLALSDVPVPAPKAGEALVRIHASGVNFIDVYFREGRYKTELPFIDGQEAAGTVEAVGEGVRDLKPGDRVAWTGVMGSYAEFAAVPADRLVKTPPGLDPKLAASVMLQGLTAHYLSHSTHALKPGEIALVHAAAGGVGLLLTQMASQAGARVIATVSTKEKAELAREAGAAEVILYTEVDFEAETRRLTGGRGVDVVYDSVGKTTFEKSLNSLRPRGMMVLFGGSSGAVPPFDLIELAAKGSLYVTRPMLKNYIHTREELVARAEEVLAAVDAGKLKVRMEHIYPLADARQAHIELEGRKTTGKLLLIP